MKLNNYIQKVWYDDDDDADGYENDDDDDDNDIITIITAPRLYCRVASSQQARGIKNSCALYTL